MISQKLLYNNLPNNGNYIFYYDPVTGKLSYVFKYSSIPIFGSYVFMYYPRDDVFIEKPQLAKKCYKRSKTQETIQTIKFQKNVVVEYVNLLQKYSKSMEFSTLTKNLNKDLSQVSLESICNLDETIRKYNEAILQDFLMVNNISDRVNSDIENALVYIQRDIEKLSYIAIEKKLIETTNATREQSFFNSFEKFSKQDKSRTGKIEIKQENFMSTTKRDSFTEYRNEKFGDKKKKESFCTDKTLKLQKQETNSNIQDFNILYRDISEINAQDFNILYRDRQDINIQDFNILHRKISEFNVRDFNILYRSKQELETHDTIISKRDKIKAKHEDIKSLKNGDISKRIGLVSKQEEYVIKNIENALIDSSETNKNITKNFKASLLDSKQEHSVKENKMGSVKDEQKFSTKNNKLTLNQEDIPKTEKLPKSVYIELDYRTEKTAKNSLVENKQSLAKKVQKGINIETEKLLGKTKKDILIEDDLELDKDRKNSKEEKIKLLDRKQQEIQEEIEEKLKLHKRFWFLKNIGSMDIKILPNRDSVYPPKIELFEESEDFSKYMYKFSEKYDVLDSDLTIKLYKNIPQGLELLKEISIDVNTEVSYSDSDISIEIKKQDINEDFTYNYKIDYSIGINYDSLMDYVVIEHPKGFQNHQFLFVTSEKFLADNHPIPTGEDLGLVEFPISIAIMVDFINILLLIWAKMYLAFSGRMGTQAIQGMVDLVYEWITLETSVEETGIEAYNRCFRWFRWECEKVYNKAKLDPNLNGNKWIEEVLFEMVVYMEMHHFNEVPQWNDIEKMDEQRNIFQDVHLDIPIVLDKFKGIRKRVISPKNKR